MSRLAFLRSTWEVLEGRASLETLLEVREVDGVANSQGPVLLGVDAQKIRHVLIPMEAGTQVMPDKRSAGVQIRKSELEDQGNLRTYVDLVCSMPYLNETFTHLTDEILEGLGSSTVLPDRYCRAVLERWRELLARTSVGELSYQTVLGVFGELWHLRRIIRLNPDGVVCWTGPSRERHDFSGAGVALEVKTTQARQGRLVEVHGHDQLEASSGVQLYLAVLKVEPSETAGETISVLVDEIIDLGAERSLLFTRLADAGLSVDDLQRASSWRLVVNEDRIYAVEGGFPRIVSASFVGGALPAGITTLRYVIDLTGEPPKPLPATETAAVYERLAGVS